MTYRVYSYGCRPIAGADDAVDQMRRRVGLWNALVEIERDYHARREDILAELAPGADAGSRPLSACPEHADAWAKKARRFQASPCPEQKAITTAWRTTRREAFTRDEVKASMAMPAPRLRRVRLDSQRRCPNAARRRSNRYGLNVVYAVLPAAATAALAAESRASVGRWTAAR